MKALAMITIAALFAACGEGVDGPDGDVVWECSVTLDLEPSVFNNLRSPSGSGSGTGTGGTREEALSSAYAQACAQLPISGTTLQACRNGEDFTVEGGGQGNIILASAVNRSVRCSGSN